MPSIPRAVIDEMIAHAREALPNEACGMVHAIDGVAASVHRVRNVEASPYRFTMDPLEMLRLERRRDRLQRQRVARGEPGGGRFARGGRVTETLFAIYHSHVSSPARPSPTDVRMAFWPPGALDSEPMYPDTYYVLVSLAEEPPPVHAFHILRGGEIVEQAVEAI